MGLWKLEFGAPHQALQGETDSLLDDHLLTHIMLGLQVGGEEHQERTATPLQ